MVLYKGVWALPDDDQVMPTNFFKYIGERFENYDDNNIVMFSVFQSPDTLISQVKNNEDNLANKVKIYFYGENTKQRFTEYKDESKFQEYIDVIAGFFDPQVDNETEGEGEDWQHKRIRVPLWILYWKFHSQGLFSIDQTQKHNAASIIARHDAYGTRWPLILQTLQCGLPIISSLYLPKYQQVPQGMIQMVRLGGENEDKLNLIKNFKINICAENTVQDGYITEKIFQCVEAGCVPLYDGPTHAIEEGILNQKRILRKLDVEKVQKIDEIAKLEVWAPHAYYNICLILLRFWCKIKQAYEHKFGELRYKKDIPIVIKEVEVVDEKVQDIVEQHWNQHKALFHPLLQIKCNRNDNSDSDEKIYSLEDLFCLGYLNFKK